MDPYRQHDYSGYGFSDALVSLVILFCVPMNPSNTPTHSLSSGKVDSQSCNDPGTLGLGHRQRLVGGWTLSLWKTWKSTGMIIPDIWKKKKWSKPPTKRTFAAKLREGILWRIWTAWKMHLMRLGLDLCWTNNQNGWSDKIKTVLNITRWSVNLKSNWINICLS